MCNHHKERRTCRVYVLSEAVRLDSTRRQAYYAFHLEFAKITIAQDYISVTNNTHATTIIQLIVIPPSVHIQNRLVMWGFMM